MRTLSLLGVLLALVGTGCGGGGGSSALELTGVVPANGGVEGGARVTLLGTRLGEVTQVTFGGVPATELAVAEGGALTCLTPAGALGVVDVVVEAGDRTSALAGFTYFAVPTLTSVAAERGSLGGGETLTLTGTGFQANNPGDVTVVIGAVPASSITVVSDTELTCRSEGQPAAGTYDVALYTHNGEARLVDGFEAVLPPTLSAVTATAGPAGGFTDVTLTGTQLDGGVLGVLFGANEATQIVAVNDTSVTCRTPEGLSGAVDVRITTHGGTATLSDAYTYTVWAPSDPLYTTGQWHLKNTNQTNPSTLDEDARTEGAWDLGYTGAGVRIAVVDDGLELLHEDLAGNIVVGESFDYGDNDSDPTRNEHGTSVAGVSSAVGGNDLGGTGAAPNSSIVGYAVLTGGVTNAEFADALARSAVDTHIYNNSWGSPLVSNNVLRGFSGSPNSFWNAIDTGLTTGRGGLGSVYFKSAGNSGSGASGCYDGTNGVRGVNVIGSVNTEGDDSAYSQDGPSILVCAPSNDGGHAGITTTDRTGSAGYSSGTYTSGFGGTSSACPLVSGVAALVLEARPQLTWWEVSLVLATSARRNDTTHPEWVQNGAGYWVNEQYGFGVVDAEEAVKLARDWTPRTGLVKSTNTGQVNATVTAGDSTGVSDIITVPTGSGITNLHTATVTVTITHPRATDLTVILTSPDGTESRYVRSLTYAGTIASNSMSGIPMVSRRHLGETVEGDWTLRIVEGQNNVNATWTSWELVLEGEGTPSPAVSLKRGTPSLRPVAPATTAGQDVWWTGHGWAVAGRDSGLIAEWLEDGASTASTPLQVQHGDLLETAVVSEGRLRVWRLRAGTQASALFEAAGGDVPPLHRVYRDGPLSDGEMRVLSGHVIVSWSPEITAPLRAAIEAAQGLTYVQTLSAGQTERLYTVAPGTSPVLKAATLQAESGIVHAAADWWQPIRAQ